MSTNRRWEEFLDSIENGSVYLLTETFHTYERDYQRCKADSEKGIPRAIKYMTEFAKSRLKS